MAPGINETGNRANFYPGAPMVMTSSMAISILIHICILLGLQSAFPTNWIVKPMQTYHVELPRDPVISLSHKKGPVNKFEAIRPEEKMSLDVREDTVFLDTKDKKYMPYVGIIKSRLMQHWKYPEEAWEALIEGDVQVTFTLDRQGNLQGITITRPSDYDVLNDEALRAIRAAEPFPPFPGSVSVTRLHINANFAYRLTVKPR